jgi:TolB protein
VYDLDSGELTEVATKDRMAVFYTPALLLGDDRMLVQVVRDKVGQIFSMNLDGSDAQPFTQAGEGLPYGMSLSPDGSRVAFHLASPDGYQVYTSDADGKNRVRLAADPAHLYFGTSWSPDGQWITYADCHYGSDPGHDWADVCVGKADGSEHRVLTQGQAMWFAATYGNATQRGGGSNLPAWSSDGQVLFPRRLPESKVAWEYQAGRPDTDHFNRDFKPEVAHGGTEIVKLNIESGVATPLTQPGEGQWDFRASESPDGKHLVFCRAATGEQPTLWVANAGGGGARLLSRGIEDSGTDHPRWLPVARG